MFNISNVSVTFTLIFSKILAITDSTVIIIKLYDGLDNFVLRRCQFFTRQICDNPSIYANNWYHENSINGTMHFYAFYVENLFINCRRYNTHIIKTFQIIYCGKPTFTKMSKDINYRVR